MLGLEEEDDAAIAPMALRSALDEVVRERGGSWRDSVFFFDEFFGMIDRTKIMEKEQFHTKFHKKRDMNERKQ